MGGTTSSVLDEAPSLKRGPDELLVYDPAEGPFWTSSGTEECKLRSSKAGKASLPYYTFHELFKLCKGRHPDQVAMAIERPLPPLEKGVRPPKSLPREQWKSWTWSEYYDESCAVAKAFLKLGMKQHDAVSVFGFNCPEWSMSQAGAILAGGKVAGIYPSDSAEQIQFKASHSGAVVMLLEDKIKYDKVVSQLDRLPKMKAIVVWGFDPEVATLTRTDGSEVKVLRWEQLVAMGTEVPQAELETQFSLIRPGHCCALIYTSGTTGDPKAAMLSHDNCFFLLSSLTAHISTGLDPVFAGPGSVERVVSYLPLSHVAGMMTDIMQPICTTALLGGRMEVYFARPYDLKVGTFGERLRAIRPTLFLGVPRVWEKIMETIKTAGADVSGIKKMVGNWAKNKGLAHKKNQQLGGSGNAPANMARAERMVLGKVKAMLGLDECKFGAAAAAPLSMVVCEYFGSLGITVHEAFGMSETSGVVTAGSNAAHMWGSCGYALEGVEVKCFIVDETDINKKKEVVTDNIMTSPEEEQGELCFRGRGIMMGYMANPELGEEHIQQINKKNSDAIDEEGWLHSGDKGCIDKRGMMKITGRYKELIIGSGGENIAPVPIEDGVKALCPGISNIMMVGDKRKFNVALLTLKASGASGELPGTDELTGEALNVSSKSSLVSEAMADPAWHKCIEDAIKEVNKGVTPPCRIQRFSILPQDFSVVTGDFTATLKLKRGVVEKKWIKTIDSMYTDDIKPGQTYFQFTPLEKEEEKS